MIPLDEYLKGIIESTVISTGKSREDVTNIANELVRYLYETLENKTELRIIDEMGVQDIYIVKGPNNRLYVH